MGMDLRSVFWKSYRKNFSPEAIVGFWFVAPLFVAFFTKPMYGVGTFILLMTIVIFLENGYSDYMKKKGK